MSTTLKTKGSFNDSNSALASTDSRTKIVRSTSSIYKRLGLNFKPLRRRQIEEFLTNESSSELSSHEFQRSPSSEAVLHDPVYSKIASPTTTPRRKAQAVIPLCVGLKTLISPTNDEKGSCRVDDDDVDKNSVSVVNETEKISIVDDDHHWSSNQRRTSWIDDSCDHRALSSDTASPLASLDFGGGVNSFRRYSLSPTDGEIFLRRSSPEIEHSNDSTVSERSMRDSGIVLHDDIGGKPVFAQRNSTSSSDVRTEMNNVDNGLRVLSPYDGRTSLNNCYGKVAQYDSDTLRKTAEKNRQTAAKLLPKLQKKRNSFSKDAVNSKHNANNHQRRETQTSSSSSKGSSSQRASSVFTDSSGGSSAGSYDVLSFHDILTEYHDQQRKHLTWRSISSENFINFESAPMSASSSGDSSPYGNLSTSHINDKADSTCESNCTCGSNCIKVQYSLRKDFKNNRLKRLNYVNFATYIIVYPPSRKIRGNERASPNSSQPGVPKKECQKYVGICRLD